MNPYIGYLSCPTGSALGLFDGYTTEVKGDNFRIGTLVLTIPEQYFSSGGSSKSQKLKFKCFNDTATQLEQTFRGVQRGWPVSLGFKVTGREGQRGGVYIDLEIIGMPAVVGDGWAQDRQPSPPSQPQPQNQQTAYGQGAPQYQQPAPQQQYQQQQQQQPQPQQQYQQQPPPQQQRPPSQPQQPPPTGHGWPSEQGQYAPPAPQWNQQQKPGSDDDIPF